jgi:hypothetical protein
MENKQQMKKADKKGRRKSHLTSTQPVGQCSYPLSACTLPLLRVLACRVSSLSFLSVWSVTDCMDTMALLLHSTFHSSYREEVSVFLLSAFVRAVSLAFTSAPKIIKLTEPSILILIGKTSPIKCHQMPSMGGK